MLIFSESKSLLWLYILIAVAVLLAIYIAVQYNGFVKLNNMVKEAFSTMDVYLKKRWDLIPNLVEVVKGYAKHESSVIEEVVKLRNLSYDKMSLVDKIDTNQQLTAGLSKIMAVVENYPNLKASQNFSDLSNQLSKIEDEIAWVLIDKTGLWYKSKLVEILDEKDINIKDTPTGREVDVEELKEKAEKLENGGNEECWICLRRCCRVLRQSSGNRR